MKNVLKVVVGISLVALCIFVLQENKNESERFLNSLVEAYSMVDDDEANYDQNTEYYRKAMQDYANLFLDIPNYYNDLDELERDLQSMGSIFCYRKERGNKFQPDYLLIHFNSPTPVFGTLEGSWNYLYLNDQTGIQCIPLYTQSNVALNGLQIVEKDNALIFQLEGRVAGYHPMQLFLGFFALTEQRTPAYLKIDTETKNGGVASNSYGETIIPLKTNGNAELDGDIYIKNHGLEVWLYNGLTAQIDLNGNIEIANNEISIERGVSGLRIASLDFRDTETVLLKLEG